MTIRQRLSLSVNSVIRVLNPETPMPAPELIQRQRETLAALRRADRARRAQAEERRQTFATTVAMQLYIANV